MGGLVLAGNTSGSTTLQATDAVTATITLPSATGTVQLANSALNGSLGATTPSTVVATTIGASGAILSGTNIGFSTANTNSYLYKPNDTNTSTGQITIQAGGGSATFGGGLILYGHSHATNAGSVQAGISTGSGGTFGVCVEGNGSTTNVFTVDGSGNVVANATIKGATTISVGAATPSASGAGITFPATQSASTDANTLDDYEEGTWTPVLLFGGAAGVSAYAQQNGTYTKVGNVVTVRAFFSITTKSAATGTAQIDGLPFNTKAGTAQYHTAYFYMASAAYTGTLTCYIAPVTTVLIVGQTNGTTGFTGLSNTNFLVGTDLIVCMSYFV
jgi:hypothetical protein